MSSIASILWSMRFCPHWNLLALWYISRFNSVSTGYFMTSKKWLSCRLFDVHHVNFPCLVGCGVQLAPYPNILSSPYFGSQNLSTSRLRVGLFSCTNIMPLIILRYVLVVWQYHQVRYIQTSEHLIAIGDISDDLNDLFNSSWVFLICISVLA